MDSDIQTVCATLFVGFVATLFMDLWGLFQSRILGLKKLDFAMVGRWIGGMAGGKFVHANIGQAEPVRGELAIGWIFHYATGLIFAVLLIVMAGPGWLAQPSILPAMAVGIGTIVAPFLVMQPAFGFGIAASRTPKPNLARLLSVATHCAFGVGLYCGGLLWSALTGVGS